MKTRLLFAALVIATGLSAQTAYTITDISGADVGDTVYAQGPNQHVAPLSVTATCAQYTAYLGPDFVVHFTDNVFPVDPASKMTGVDIGIGGQCHQPLKIMRRTYSMQDPTINPVPGVGSELDTTWTYLGSPYELHEQIQMTCDGATLNIRRIPGPFPC